MQYTSPNIISLKVWKEIASDLELDIDMCELNASQISYIQEDPYDKTISSIFFFPSLDELSSVYISTYYHKAGWSCPFGEINRPEKYRVEITYLLGSQKIVKKCSVPVDVAYYIKYDIEDELNKKF